MTIHERLMKLFLLDKQVRGLESRLDQAMRRQKAVTQRWEEYNRQKESLLHQQKESRVKASAAEVEAQEIAAKENKLREQMNSVKNNREYSALLVEVSTLKNSRGKIEEQALEFMTRAEEFNDSIAEIEGRIADQRTLVDAAERDTEAARAEVGQRLSELREQRDEAGGQIPPELLKTFQRLSDAYDGEAMASIEEVNKRRREYSCNGCFMQVPLERVSVLFSGAEQVVSCPSCGRLLYHESAASGHEKSASSA
ncbi:MAG: hypothetical protein JJU36_12710 [Phycisphaeraceae bacterium]|nr:hypothetical protein [Phycisphaeraceae bacterium]